MKSILYRNSLVFLLLILSFASIQAQLNEGFEGTFPPAGWAVLDNGVCLSNQWQKSTLNPNSGTAHAYVKFSNSSSDACEDWLVTPKLLPDPSNNSLTFFATDDAQQNYGSVYTVRVSTSSQSDRNSFTILNTYLEGDFTHDVYQQFTVDLSSYNNQEIFVAFVLENSRGDSFFLDDVSGPDEAPVNTAPNCDAVLTEPADGTIEVPIETLLSWSPATGDPTGYKLRIGTTSGASDFLDFTDTLLVTTTYTPLSNFAYATTYYVNILPTNAIGDATVGTCTEYSFTTEADPSIVLDCAGTGDDVTQTLCYVSSVNEEFTISSNNSDQVQILFNAGEVEENQDELYIYDGVDDTGALLNVGMLYGNAGDLTGLSYISSTGSLFIRITPDQTIDCQNGDLAQIEFTASCVNCIPPAGTVAVGTCDEMNDQFNIDVDVTGLGDGTVIIRNDQNMTTETVTMTGIISLGPFDFGTVIITLENQADAQCSVELLPVTLNGCPPANDDCADAIALTLSPDNTCANTTNGTTVFASIFSDTLCSAEQLDVWYSFTPATTDEFVFELSNSEFSSFAVYEGDCISGLILLTENCFDQQFASVDLIQGQTYLVQVFADAEQTESFDLCVYAQPVAPTNDLCSNATVISCPAGDISNNIDITYATSADAASCNDDGIGQGVWYQIAGTGDYLNITVNPDQWDAEIQIWSGVDCNSLNCETRVDEGNVDGVETITDFQTMMGTTYYIYVGAFAENQATGLFNLTVFCAEFPTADVICLDDPENDPCNDIQIDNGTIEGTVTACETIETTVSDVIVLSGTAATFIAGTSITLKAGFHAQAGADFHAFIATCAPAAPEETLENRSEQPSKLEENGTGHLQLKLSPNPAQSEINVAIYLPSQESVQISLLDMNGKLMKNVEQLTAVEGWNNFRIQRENWSNGFYFLTIQTATQSLTEKIILSE